MSRISIVHLNEKFFNEHAEHAEILKKPGRPHLVLILQVESITFAIPALEFSKAVIVTAEDIGNATRIDNNEFKELRDHFHEIESKFLAYLKHYIKSIKTQTNLDSPEIKYSALQYFTDKLLSFDLEDTTKFIRPGTTS